MDNNFIYNCKIIEYPNGQYEVRYYKNGKYHSCKNKDSVLLDSCESQSKDSIILTDNNLRSFTSSVNRSKNNIYELAHSNNWDIFVTLTFSDKNDRTDYDLLVKKLGNWLNHLKRICPDIAYIVVPEEHKRIEDNGLHAYHFHGLFANIDGLTLTPALKKNGNLLYTKNGLQIFNIKNYHLGFSSATYVQDTYRATSYITKYVTKALCIRQKNKRRYLASRNLKRPNVSDLIINDEYSILNAFAINHEKHIDVNVGEYHDTISYYHVSKLNDDDTIMDIINKLQEN